MKVNGNLLICKICHDRFKHLGSHIWHKHKIKANEYKERFGLPHNLALITDEIKEKKQKHFEKFRDKYLKNILGKGKRFYFKKGKRKTVGGYISPKTKKEQLLRILKVNKNRKPEKCPVCNMIFDKLDSHLYNKHKLLRTK